MSKITARLKITLLQYNYYYDKMNIEEEEIKNLGSGLYLVTTNGIIDNRQCTLLDFERLDNDDCYLVLY